MRRLVSVTLAALFCLCTVAGCSGGSVSAFSPDEDISGECGENNDISLLQSNQFVIYDDLGEGVWFSVYSPSIEVINQVEQSYSCLSKSAPITVYCYSNGKLEQNPDYCEFILFDDNGEPTQDFNVVRYSKQSGEFCFRFAYDASLSSKAVDVLADYWENGEVFRFVFYDIYLIAVSQYRVVIIATIPIKPMEFTEHDVTSEETLVMLKDLFRDLHDEVIVDISVPN